MDIGKIIKEERTKRGVTQADMAQEFFVTRQLISKWEHNKSYPDLEQVVKLSEYFDLSLDELLKEDQTMIKELNFDSKQKKWLKLAVIFFISIFVAGGLIFGVMVWHDSVVLRREDIQVTKITKKYLPAKETKNQLTGQIVKIPADVEYTIYFKTKRPFINLSGISGYKNVDGKDSLQVTTIVYRELFGAKKEGKIVVQSDRETSFQKDSLNINKDIYLFDSYFDGPPNENPTKTENLLATKDQLQALPNQ